MDLKSDRQNRVLRVQSAWTEPDAPAGTPERLAGLLRETATWQGLDRVEVMPRGNLAPALAGEFTDESLTPAGPRARSVAVWE